MTENYYFSPNGDYHVVDIDVLSAHHASVTKPTRNGNFREAVAARDGRHCVITGEEECECDAAHIIPHSKRDGYINLIFLQRGHLYGVNPGTVAVNIDSPRNGIFLSRGLHSRFGRGASAFLRTPNFALQTADIPGRDDEALSRTTIQHIEPYIGRCPIPQYDVEADWSTPDSPPSILLDFMYGVAIIKRWATDAIRQDLLHEQGTLYSTILSAPPTTPPSEDEASDGTESTDTELSEYIPSSESEAIDVLAFGEYFMGSHGSMIHEATREKVEGWLHTSVHHTPWMALLFRIDTHLCLVL